jgi:hypothetical protein
MRLKKNFACKSGSLTQKIQWRFFKKISFGFVFLTLCQGAVISRNTDTLIFSATIDTTQNSGDTSQVKIPAWQQKKVSGTVVDENGFPMIGVSVKYKDDFVVTITDLNGQYVLMPPKDQNKVVEFSFIGYKTREIVVGQESNVVKLTPEIPVSKGKTEEGCASYVSKNESDKAHDKESEKSKKQRKSHAKWKNFGEKEFRQYFEDNRLRYLCDGNKASITASFDLDNTGKAQNIKILKCDCEELEADFLRLIKKSPAWSGVERTITLILELK